jgi:hypothetical protein
VGYEARTQRVVLAKDLVVTLSLDRTKKGSGVSVRSTSVRRGSDSRRVARVTSSGGDLGQDPELPPAPRVSAPPQPATAPAAPSVAPAPSQTIINPAGGHAPIRPIQTTSPYDTK